MDFQYLTFMIDSPLEEASLAVDPNEYLIHVPAPLDVLTSRSPLPLSKLSSKEWSKAISLEPDGLMADLDATLLQEVLDLA